MIFKDIFICFNIMSQIGGEAAGKSINWRYLNEDRINDPVISALMKEAFEDLSLKEEIIDINICNIYIEFFNIFLKDNGYKFSFKNIQTVLTSSKKLTKKELTIQQIKITTTRKLITLFIEQLVITNNIPCSLDIKKPIESFLCVVYWAIFLLAKRDTDINLSFFLNCSISLFRAIEDLRPILHIDIINDSTLILDKLEKVIYSKNKNIILTNLHLISDSYWDKEKPKSITLYKEQKDILSLISSRIIENFFIMYEVPPANGKTVLSAIIAKIIAEKNKVISEKRSLLYICYNTIVRNEVAKLCITHNVDVKYWMAIYKLDNEDGKHKTYLRPYKNCYPDWNNRSAKFKRSPKEEKAYTATKWKKFSENIHDQWEYFIHETRLMADKNKAIPDINNADNIPQMIISDLESAYILLKEFPNKFIVYFDEAFASAELEITSKIMSVLSQAVLVSATLSKPTEIPTVINDFKLRHALTDDNFLQIVKSNKQHISCTFIDPEGYIFAPHQDARDIKELILFNETLNEPLIKRAYSPEVVLSMSSILDEYLPEILKFKTVFPYFGLMTHESMRQYACDILKFIAETDNMILLEKLMSRKIKKIANMDVESILADSAIHYHKCKTLHVASLDMNLHINRLSKPFLDGSPKIDDIISSFEKRKEVLQNRLNNLNKNGDRESESERVAIEKELNDIVINWPEEYILNSAAHADKFGVRRYLNQPNIEIFGSISDINILNDIQAKLLFSGIGIYHPESFSDCEMDLFLRNKDNFKFILSTPSIVYGTNISLSIIDIDSSFIRNSTFNTLYQLIGRAGRKGKSNSATIIFRDRDMLNMILHKDIRNIEAEQIEGNYQNLLASKN